MKALEVSGLSKEFGGIQALQDVSFSVEEGEHLGIIGPNGAGKTTLFNILNGQLPITTGQIFFFGQEISKLPDYRRAHLGLTRSFQITSLFFNLTILENVLLALQGTQRYRFHVFRPITAYEDLSSKAKGLLKLIGLWEKRDEPAKNISYGEQRRFEIALTLALEPQLVLLDEPSNGLTAAETADLINIIRNLRSDITAIIVAHDMDLIFSVAERIIVIHYGRILAEGTPEEIKNNSTVKEIYMGIQETTEDAGSR